MGQCWRKRIEECCSTGGAGEVGGCKKPWLDRILLGGQQVTLVYCVLECSVQHIEWDLLCSVLCTSNSARECRVVVE